MFLLIKSGVRKVWRMVKISACVIVKNEEKNIQKWLGGVMPLADEWIVVDTGSTDQTIEIAKRAGAMVYDFPWENDFSAAKNFAIEKARGTWILFLDADEYIPAECFSRVREAIQRFQPQRKIMGLGCRLFNIDVDQGNRLIDSILQVRIFRNMQLLRYTGKIHESLQYDQGRQTLQLQLLDNVKIYHTGYSAHIVKKKLERNLAMLQDKIKQQGGERPEDYYYFMDCYFGLGEYEKTAKYAQLAIDSGIQMIGIDGNEYSKLVKSLLLLDKPTDVVLAAVDKAIERYPQAAEFYFLRAMTYWREKNYLSVEEDALRGLELWQQECEHVSLGQVGCGIHQVAAGYLYLGKIARMKFQDEQALEYFLAGLQQFLHHTELFLAMYDCIRDLSPTDIIQFINKLYDRDCDAVFLTRLLQQKQSGKVYLYYANRLKQKTASNMVACYNAAGRSDAASIQLADELASLYRLGTWAAAKQGEFPQQSKLAMLLPKEYWEKWYRQLGVNVSTESVEKVVSDGEERLVEKAVALFNAGSQANAIEMLSREFQRVKDSPLLSYALATLLRLIGQTESARRVLLQTSRPLDEARALWKVLQTDEDFPLVSIMVPTYNRPELFEKTLQSACAQTYTNIEILVCDNSTDDITEKIMKKYESDLRVTYQRNRSAKTKAENFRPFEVMAKGEYLQWLMDDDILAPEKISKMMACFQNHPEVSLVTSERGAIDADDNILPKPYAGFVKIEGECSIYSGETIAHLLLLNRANFIGEPSAVLFRRSQLTHHYWNADCRGYQTISDVVMWLELLEKGKCAFFKESLSYFRKHPGQEGQQVDSILLSRIEWVHLWQECYAGRKFSCTEQEYKEALQYLYKEKFNFLRVDLPTHASKLMWQRYLHTIEPLVNIIF